MMQTEVPHTMETPFLTILAGKDILVDNEGAKRIYEKAPATVKELIEFDEACHSLLGDKEFSDDVIKATLAFFDKRIATN